MRRFKIITNTTKDSHWNFTRMVCRFLTEHEAEYVIEAGKLNDKTPGRPENRLKDPSAPFEPEAVIVLGGDGTVLQAAGRAEGSETPILGINLGTVGYLAEIDRDNWQEALMQLFNGCYYIEQRMKLEGCLAARHPIKPKESREQTLAVANAWDSEEVKAAVREEQERKEQSASNGSNVSDLTDVAAVAYDTQASGRSPMPQPDYNLYHALNDVVIARVGALRVINYDVYVNGKFLNSYNADGIIVSTPTGSTGYNLSAGGPIVEPSAEMIVLTPICPHQINVRSIVLSAKDVITIRIGSTSRQRILEAEADFDGGSRVTLSTGDAVSIRRSDQVTRLIKFENRSFLEILHQKMNQ